MCDKLESNSANGIQKEVPEKGEFGSDQNNSVTKSSGVDNSSILDALEAGSSKNSETRNSSLVMEEAKKGFALLAEGTRSMLISDYLSAVELLSESCEILSISFGELASECAEAYYYYGKACFELAKIQLESGNDEPLGIKVEQQDRSNGINADGGIKNCAAEKQDIVGTVMKKELLGSDGAQESSNGSEGTAVAKGREEVDVRGNGKATTDINSDQSAKCVQEEKDSSEEEEQNNEEEEDDVEEDKDHASEEEEIENIQLAWEALECAKKIFEREKNNSRLADVLLLLGDISMISGNYADAVEDITRAFELQKMQVSSASRSLGGTAFMLGVAYHMSHKYDSALKYLKESLRLIQLQIDELQGDKDAVGGVCKEEQEEKERLEEYKDSVISRIASINEDLKIIAQGLSLPYPSSVTAGIAAAGVSENYAPFAEPEGKAAAADLPVHDISHLVRSKGTKRKQQQDDDNLSGIKQQKGDSSPGEKAIAADRSPCSQET